jgi:cytoskeleton protein RodZ
LGAFGEKFRKQREKRAFSLDDVANVTKIGSRMLKAIEEERFEQLPGGVFNKGFIRTYAKHLGLNEEDAIHQYLEILQQKQADAQQVIASTEGPATKRAAAPKNRVAIRPAKATKSQPQVQDDDEDDGLPHLQLPKAEHVRARRVVPGGDRPRFSWAIPALVVLVVVGGAYLWNRHSHSARADDVDSRTNQAAAPVQTSQAQPAPTQVSLSQPAQDQMALAQPAPIIPVPHAANEHETDASNHDLATPDSRPALSLTIRAAENSWVSVTADGQHVTQETLIAPAHTSFRASREIVVRAGNAAAVSFLFNGKEFPPQGSEGEVKTLIFDASGLKPVTPTPSADPSTKN